jgi:GGDEF domain-containing protein
VPSGPGLLVMRMLPTLLMVAAPRVHLLQARAQVQPRRRRPYSLLPYLTVTATFGLLCAELLPHAVNRGVLGALIGMALITALVVVRQLAAFHENADLLERLAYQASHDPLTGLANRTFFTERLAEAVRAGGPVTVVLVDLDGFKQVNDTLGHHAGDLMLVAVADRLRRSVRAGDTVARLGGDEFAMLLPDAARLPRCPRPGSADHRGRIQCAASPASARWSKMPAAGSMRPGAERSAGWSQRFRHLLTCQWKRPVANLLRSRRSARRFRCGPVCGPGTWGTSTAKRFRCGPVCGPGTWGSSTVRRSRP